MNFLTSLYNCTFTCCDVDRDDDERAKLNHYTKFETSQTAVKDINAGHPLMIAEILINIISNLKIHEYANFCRVCSAWQMTNNSQYVWKALNANSDCIVDKRCESIREGIFHNGSMKLEELLRNKNCSESIFKTLDKLMYKNIKEAQENYLIFDNTQYGTIKIDFFSPSKFQTANFYLTIEESITLYIENDTILIIDGNLIIYDSDDVFSDSYQVERIIFENSGAGVIFQPFPRMLSGYACQMSFDSIPIEQFLKSITRM